MNNDLPHRREIVIRNLTDYQILLWNENLSYKNQIDIQDKIKFSYDEPKTEDNFCVLALIHQELFLRFTSSSINKTLNIISYL